MCSPICETNYEGIYDKFDDLSEFVIHTLNASLANANSELNLIINQSSRFIIKKLNNNLVKLSHHHAKLDANFHVLVKLLTVQPDETEENLHLVEQKVEYRKGMNTSMFIVAFILFFITGYWIEYVRIKMGNLYT